MALDNILNQKLIEEKEKFAAKEYSSYLSTQRFKHEDRETEIITNYSKLFLGGFYAAKEQKKDEVKKLSQEIQRMYFTALSTANILSINQSDLILDVSINNLNFKTSDYESNLRILNNLDNEILKRNININAVANSYFLTLNEILIKNLNGIIKDDTIKITKTKSLELKKETIKEEEINLENTKFEKINYDDIIGNTDAKNAITTSIKKLFLYDEAKKMNPALQKMQFKQNYLLIGEPGNGKGMLAAYAATLGEEISKKVNKNLKIITMENNSRYQDGPILKLIDYFKTITNTNDLFLIIMDEIDSAFTTRTDNKTQNYQKKLVTELLKFTSNSVEYLNKGNYIITAMTNNPTELDPAFLNRMNKGIYLCEGPKTKEEKTTLIKKILYKNVPEDKIQINNWNMISDEIQKTNLSGRELKNCVENILEQNSKKDIPLSLINETYEKKLRFFDEFKTITEQKVLQEVYRTINNRKIENYLHKGGYNVNN